MSDLAKTLDQLIAAVSTLQKQQQRQDPMLAKEACKVLGYPSPKSLRDAVSKGDILLGDEAFQRGSSEKAPWMFNTEAILTRWQQESAQTALR